MSTTLLRTGDLSRRPWIVFMLWRIPLILILVGMVWPAATGHLWATGFFWIGAACSANALRCGRVHCTIMGPVFIALGLAAVAKQLGLVSLSWNLIGPAALGFVLIAFVPEFFGKKYFGAEGGCDTSGG